MPEWEIREGDCLEVLAAVPDAAIDAMVTDPPAGIEFMGKAWDTFRPGQDNGVWGSYGNPYARRDTPRFDKAGDTRAAFVTFLTAVMSECYRVLKPGAHALVWAIPRTSHWTATAIEDAGFEVRDVITHHFGSGFPKSLDVSKAIDKAAGAAREKVATPDAATWQGWGTALKPASEHWILCRKPLAARNVAANVLEYGVGALNVDACRVGMSEADAEAIRNMGGYGQEGWEREPTGRYNMNVEGHLMPTRNAEPHAAGRWPANLVLSHADGCVEVGVRKVQTGVAVRHQSGGMTFGGDTPKAPLPDQTYADPDGTETVAAYECTPDCPVAELDRQSGESVAGAPRRDRGRGGIWAEGNGIPAGPQYGDTGGASRFFYTPKADRTERTPANTVGLRNLHPTVKPVELMRWLCRLITPPGGLVLDPFAGSGTTGIAALREGFRFLGVEREPEYVQLARTRIEDDAPLFNMTANGGSAT